MIRFSVSKGKSSDHFRITLRKKFYLCVVHWKHRLFEWQLPHLQKLSPSDRGFAISIGKFWIYKGVVNNV